MKEIYVVQGATGEYSDHSEWPVRAFESEVNAQDFVLAVSNAARIGIATAAATSATLGRSYRPQNELDPHMRVDYTGVNYSYFSVELVP